MFRGVTVNFLFQASADGPTLTWNSSAKTTPPRSSRSMAMRRRDFLKRAFLTTGAALVTNPLATADEKTEFYFQGTTAGYQPWRVIDEGRKIQRIETFTKDAISVCRVTTEDGASGWGQLSTYDADISAMVLHRKIAQHALGMDPAHIDTIVDRAIEANHKFPWSFVNRALSGLDTAIWDLYGRIQQKPVVELLGGKLQAVPAYASSMRRDISPEDEGQRLKQLQQQHGYRAFKVRVGRVNGRNKDQWPGRTEKLIPHIRQALGDQALIGADANSGYTPDKAIEVGTLMQDHGYYFFEEPCPYWELEWTATVAKALDMLVTGGEQDNDLAQWRRMIAMHAVDLIQPDILYLGGVTRTLRAARMAEQAGKKCIPHSANKAMVSVFTLHLMGALPNAGPFFEYSIEEGGVARVAKQLYQPQLKTIDGAVPIPDGPGWGVDFRQSWLDKAVHQVSQL
jgi:L-alanine-DL-glutamate epimerase-like enolase superfamily enzyme